MGTDGGKVKHLCHLPESIAFIEFLDGEPAVAPYFTLYGITPRMRDQCLQNESANALTAAFRQYRHATYTPSSWIHLALGRFLKQGPHSDYPIIDDIPYVETTLSVIQRVRAIGQSLIRT
jgi:hypothetical protein